ncbi:hypothetical protein AVEN_160863-1 [Araneus ventricosus]|uniref:Secreted protein n=1 Tax=Araneus ventricosus TaxID=182803 RepID=A0A4Y2UFU2_ARAVE|nr:hypothetical protein AVEN_160863-1 [Araneus ventricosus]
MSAAVFCLFLLALLPNSVALRRCNPRTTCTQSSSWKRCDSLDMTHCGIRSSLDTSISIQPHSNQLTILPRKKLSMWGSFASYQHVHCYHRLAHCGFHLHYNTATIPFLQSTNCRVPY